jgi:hypothetical protein
MKRTIWIFVLINAVIVSQLQAQTTASFNFSLNTQTVSGWTNVHGDPSVAVRTATSSSGITISSMATANWAGYSSTAAYDGGGASGGSFFAAAVMANMWYQYSPFYGAYNAAVPQLEIGGLNIDSVYTLQMTASFTNNVPNTFNLNPMRYTVAGTSVYGYIDVNGNFNTTDGATFHNIAPDASGKIHVYVNTLSTTNVAGISGLVITSGHTTAPTPTVSISKPTNGSIIPEDGNVSISATASETGGSIARVEFYADTTLIGVDSSAPYNFVWTNPDPGNYAIKARAVDGTGNTSSTTINIAVESLNYFWSTTGNIAVNSDSFFLGTVDTSKLVIRSKNIPRISVDSGGKVDIGLTNPSTPAFRVYKNGDLTASTTMDTTVNTERKSGMRYYSKYSLLQLGASDRVDTTKNVYQPTWPGAGILINSKNHNTIKGRIIDSYVGGNTFNIDTSGLIEESIMTGQNVVVKAPLDDLLVAGYGITFNATASNGLISGNGHQINKLTGGTIMGGFVNYTQDTCFNSIIGGWINQVGGLSQLVSGQYLVNRTPFGTTLGNTNVDFRTQHYTGIQGTNISGIAGYPLFALGNSSTMDSSIRSNALTILYNGRTQINTTGHTTALAQTDVTPKAALEVVSTNSGVLLPKLTTAQRNAIARSDLLNGLLLYNTDSSTFQFYNGSAWTSVGSGSGSNRWQYASGTVYDSADNIGIGTNNTQGYKLAVNGTAIFTKVKVKTAGTWPDYVFKPGYNLTDLVELEHYIAEHKHLPGIVSEADVQREGAIDVGDQQAAVLKKVEELTLYLIDENKKLKEQNARLEQQQKEIDELKKLIRKEK